MVRVKPYFVSAALLLATACVLGIPLEAQVPPGWVQVGTGKVSNALIGARILPASGGYQVYFKNFGTTPVHFGFYLQGAQPEDAVPGNGRIHLKPGNPVGPILIAPQAGGTGALIVHAVDIVCGNQDVPTSAAE
jgi:hypothetical protein